MGMEMRQLSLAYPRSPYSFTSSPSNSTRETSLDLLPDVEFHDYSTPLSVEDDNDDHIFMTTEEIEGQGLFGRMRQQKANILWKKVESSLYILGVLVFSVLYQLLPSFVQSFLERRQRRKSENKTSPGPPESSTITTSPTPGETLNALNGIRGVACFIVFNFHFLLPFTKTIMHGFYAGAITPEGNVNGENNKNNYAHQLPLLCLLHRGRAGVCVFFVLSGYVLSFRFLQLTRARQWASSQRTISSLTIRRAIRLFLPPTISMIIVMLAAWWGAFDPASKVFKSHWVASGEPEPHPSRRETFQEHLGVFWKTWWDWSSVWIWHPMYIEYDPHLWTIPIEFRGSLALFLALLGTCRLRPLWRCILVTLLAVYCMRFGRWEICVFLSGMVLAEGHLMIRQYRKDKEASLPHTTDPHIANTITSASSSSSTTSTSSGKLSKMSTKMSTAIRENLLSKLKRFSIPSIYWKTCLWLILLLSLYILSFPDYEPETTPGFSTLASWTVVSLLGQKYLFWHSIASILFVFTAELLPLVQTIFELSIPQYLGQISYALYLVHGPLQHSFSFALQPLIWTRMMGLPDGPNVVDEAAGTVIMEQGKYNSLWCAGLFVNWIFTLIITIWLADLFWRVVDKNCVKLARKFETLISLTVEEQKGEKRGLS